MMESSARGFTLLELLVASVLFLVVALAVGTFYIATVKGFERGSAQAYVQRVGSQVESELVRHLSGAVAFHSGRIFGGSSVGPSCGPSGAESFIFERPLLSGAITTVLHPCRYCCVYQAIEGTFPGHPVVDVFPQLYLCTIPDITSSSPIACSPNTEIRQLTAGPPRDRDTGGRQVAIQNATFTRVVSLCNLSPFSACGPGNTAANCTTETGSNCSPANAPRAEIQFQICQPDPQASTTTPCTDPARPPSLSPLTFSLTATARN